MIGHQATDGAGCAKPTDGQCTDSDSLPRELTLRAVLALGRHGHLAPAAVTVDGSVAEAGDPSAGRAETRETTTATTSQNQQSVRSEIAPLIDGRALGRCTEQRLPKARPVLPTPRYCSGNTNPRTLRMEQTLCVPSGPRSRRRQICRFAPQGLHRPWSERASASPGRRCHRSPGRTDLSPAVAVVAVTGCWRTAAILPALELHPSARRSPAAVPVEPRSQRYCGRCSPG